MQETWRIDSTDATRAVILRYIGDLYGHRDLTLVPELLAEPMRRHDAGGKVAVLTHEDCRDRIGGFFRTYRELTFRTVHLIVEGTLASWTYDSVAIALDGTLSHASSIEIFEVKDGTITDVWNAPYANGPWA